MKHRNTFSLLSPTLLAAVAFLLMTSAAPRAEAQVLVYRMEFSKTGNSINFQMYDQAYFVVDGLGGNGTFIVTYREDGRDFYLSSADSGELFFAVRPGAERAVIRAGAENGTAQSQYLLIGDLNSKISVNLRGQQVTLAVSTYLRGSAMASDSESGVDFLTADGSLGFAGFAHIEAWLDRNRTRSANRANQAVADVVADLIEDLENSGIEDGADDGTDTGTDDGTDDGTDADTEEP